MASIANHFIMPTKHLQLIGITGTNGKTSTTYMVKEILNFLEGKVGTYRHDC